MCGKFHSYTLAISCLHEYHNSQFLRTYKNKNFIPRLTVVVKEHAHKLKFTFDLLKPRPAVLRGSPGSDRLYWLRWASSGHRILSPTDCCSRSQHALHTSWTHPPISECVCSREPSYRWHQRLQNDYRRRCHLPRQSADSQRCSALCHYSECCSTKSVKISNTYKIVDV